MPTAKQKAAQERFRAAVRQAKREGKKGKSYARRVGELLRGRASHGGGQKTKKAASSGGSKHSSTPSSGGRSRMAKKEAIPIIGVRGSDTNISAAKTVVVGGATLLGFSKIPGDTNSPVMIAVKTQDTKLALSRLGVAAQRSWDSGHGKVAVAALGTMAVFGKKIDKALRRFHLPIKFGR